MPPPGETERASHAPSGDQDTSPTGSSNAVTSSGYPPAAGIVHTCGLPLTLDTKAMVLPSGEKLGAEAAPTFAISSTRRSTSSPARQGAARHASRATAARVL